MGQFQPRTGVKLSRREFMQQAQALIHLQHNTHKTAPTEHCAVYMCAFTMSTLKCPASPTPCASLVKRSPSNQFRLNPGLSSSVWVWPEFTGQTKCVAGLCHKPKRDQVL